MAIDPQIANPAGLQYAQNALINRQSQQQQGFQNNLAMRDQGMQEQQFAASQNALQTQQTKADEQEKLKYAYAATETALRSKDPYQTITAMAQRDPTVNQFFQAAQIDPSNKEQVIAALQTANDHARSKLGIAPEVKYATIDGPRGSRIQVDPLTNQQKQIVGPDNTQASAPASYRTLTPAEIAAAGMPPGTSAQRGADGKIDVLSKRDTGSQLSQKDSTTAKMKLNTVKLARQQLGRIREQFDGIKGSMSAGPFGQGKIPTEGGNKFDAAVNQMRSTLTALTRVPGVGSMSDYETKLDQSKFPNRNDYESVTEQQISDLDNMLNAIESGYTDLMGGSQQPAQSQQPQSGPVRVSSPQEAMQLPPGTQFVTPDGRVKVR